MFMVYYLLYVYVYTLSVQSVISHYPRGILKFGRCTYNANFNPKYKRKTKRKMKRRLSKMSMPCMDLYDTCRHIHHDSTVIFHFVSVMRMFKLKLLKSREKPVLMFLQIRKCTNKCIKQ